MHDPHRNTGAAFARTDGSTWAHNAVHVPTDAELARRGYKLLPEPLVLGARLAEVPAASPVPADWPLQMSPALYLRLHPTGPHAALAQRSVGAPPTTSDDAGLLEQEEGADGRADE